MRAELAAEPAHRDLRGRVVLFMAIAAALGTAAIYPLQPAIADVAISLGSSTAAVGVALACGPAGYLVGLGLVVPLVDRFPPRYVLAAQFIALGVSIGATAAVPTSWLLGLCVLLSGLCSSVGAGLESPRVSWRLGYLEPAPVGTGV